MSNTALIIDGEKSARKELELLLAREELAVLASGDFDAAQSILERESIDVLIADLTMHGGNGWKLALGELEKNPQLIVFASSRTVDLKLGRAMLKRGVREILYKPYSPQMLIKKIAFALRAQTPAPTG